jgi:hypothetical protein
MSIQNCVSLVALHGNAQSADYGIDTGYGGVYAGIVFPLVAINPSLSPMINKKPGVVTGHIMSSRPIKL